MRRAILRTVYVCILVHARFLSVAQIEVAAAMDLGYPVVINNNNTRLHYSQFSAGMRLGLSYKPANVQFFPTLYFSFARTRLPLEQFNTHVLAMNANYLNLMLNGNFVFPVGYQGNLVYVIGGIGAARFNPREPYVSGDNGEAHQVHIDSVTDRDNYFPAMELGIEYVYGNSVNSNIYISIGANVQCILFYPDRNNYYATITDPQQNNINLHGSLDGRAFMPSVSLNLHYILGKEVFFWSK